MGELFRKKNLERINSPEQLNDYIRVSNPGVWMILTAIIILLVGVCAWGVFGSLDTRISTTAICQDGVVICYVNRDDASEFSGDITLAVDGEEYPNAVVSEPTSQELEGSAYALLPSKSTNASVYKITVAAPELKDGSYQADIITRREAPISFVLN